MIYYWKLFMVDVIHQKLVSLNLKAIFRICFWWRVGSINLAWIVCSIFSYRSPKVDNGLELSFGFKEQPFDVDKDLTQRNSHVAFKHWQKSIKWVSSFRSTKKIRFKIIQLLHESSYLFLNIKSIWSFSLLLHLHFKLLLQKVSP